MHLIIEKEFRNSQLLDPSTKEVKLTDEPTLSSFSRPGGQMPFSPFDCGLPIFIAWIHGYYPTDVCVVQSLNVTAFGAWKIHSEIGFRDKWENHSC